MIGLCPDDFKNNKIVTMSLIYVFRSRNKISDECCGFWNFINLNDKNELIISNQNNLNETWALEWYSSDNGGYGWFPYSNRNYHLRNVEYSVVLLNKNTPLINQTAHILYSLKG